MGRLLALTLFFIGSASAANAAVELRANQLFEVFGLPVTNSMVTSWVVSLLLLVAVRVFVGRPKLVPNRGQAVIEGALDGIRGVVEPIVGKKAIGGALPLLLCLFVFILIQNWSGLIPGVGSIGIGHHLQDGTFHITHPFIRPGNADMNGTAALAIVAMIAWLFLIIRYAGVKAILFDIFGNKATKGEVSPVVYYPLTVLFLLVGIIEIVSILFRPVSLSFRLFGNVFGGENLIHEMMPWGAFPFYFMEVLVGFVQALVFTLLTAVYIGLICNHGDEHEGEHH